MTYDEFKMSFKDANPDFYIRCECVKCKDIYHIPPNCGPMTFALRNKCYPCLPDKPEIKMYVSECKIVRN